MRTISLLILALTASSVMGLEDTWLSLAYGLWPSETPVTTQTVLDSLNYCASSKTASGTCCDASTINGFQDKADQYMEMLEGNAADRDLYMLERRAEIEGKRGAFERIKAASDKLINYTSTNQTLLNVMATAQATYGLLAETLSNWDELVSNFTDYQNARATCINSVMETVSALWCLACHPTIENLAGVTIAPTAALDIHWATKRVLRVDCFPYIEHANLQSKILTAYYYRHHLDNLAGAMETLTGGDSGEIEALHTKIQAVRVPENEITGPGKHPEGCVSTSECEWFFYEVLKVGVLQNATLIRGGSPLRSAAFVDPATRLLSSDDAADNGRMLAAGLWQPTATEIILDINFNENPGEFVNSAPIRNGFIACVITLVASLFF